MRCMYEYTFNLNAMHSMRADGSGKHAHTFHIVLFIETRDNDEFVPYFTVEAKIEEYLGKYNGVFLNEAPEFDCIIPICEDIGNVFFKALSKIINDGHFILQRLEIDENPRSRYIIE